MYSNLYIVYYNVKSLNICATNAQHFVGLFDSLAVRSISPLPLKLSVLKLLYATYLVFSIIRR